MSNIQNLIATVLFSGVTAASFAQAPVAPKVMTPVAPAVAAVAAPAVATPATTTHSAKKVEVPSVKDAAPVAHTERASKPAHKVKVAHTTPQVKKTDTPTLTVPATK